MAGGDHCCASMFGIGDILSGRACGQTRQPHASYPWKAELAWGLRGNMCSFLLPWEQVLAELYAKFEDGDLSEWPLRPEALRHIVRVRLERGPEDLLQKFKD